MRQKTGQHVRREEPELFLQDQPNVGSMFRTADGAGVTHMHLAGFTPTPAHPKLVKTALGAEATVAAWAKLDGCSTTIEAGAPND